MGETVSPESWIGGDLRLDDDELGWTVLEMEQRLSRSIAFTTDVFAYLPRYAGLWFHPSGFPDLKVRELYAFAEFRSLVGR